ncbi:hypothetical protein SESBI_07232 [Sesbania bispinosa]|nr:hypothetical protein SESBI_07232 [Sesbania bispinosa]
MSALRLRLCVRSTSVLRLSPSALCLCRSVRPFILCSASVQPPSVLRSASVLPPSVSTASSVTSHF